jgi:hypothetical protein
MTQFYTNKHGSTSTQDLLIYPAEVMVVHQAAQFTSHMYLLVLEGVFNMVDKEDV